MDATVDYLRKTRALAILAGMVRERPSLPATSGQRLMPRTRAEMRTRHMSPRTEEAYLGWIRRYILFHGKRHPGELGAEDVTQFLSHLAVHGRVARRGIDAEPGAFGPPVSVQTRPRGRASVARRTGQGQAAGPAAGGDDAPRSC